MKIVYLGNNLTGLNVLKWLVERGESIVGLGVHPDDKAKYKEDIIAVSGLEKNQIFDGSRINQLDIIKKIRGLHPDIILSVLFVYKLSEDVLSIPGQGSINLHTSYLPFNRGIFPNVWSIVDETPAGITIHYMDEGIDTGDIIAQKEVPVDFTDTGETLYHRLEEASLVLFKETWPKIKSDTHKGVKQPQKGTFHRKRDVEKIDRIDLNRSYRAKDLINILRARTFPPYEGAFVELDDRKIFLELNMKEK